MQLYESMLTKPPVAYDLGIPNSCLLCEVSLPALDLTEVWHPGAGCGYGHQDLLVGEVEGHGELAQPRQPGQGPGDQLPCDAVHADDEEPLGEAP